MPMTALLSDLTAAWRSVSVRPLATLAIVLTLGIGLGASAAMFTVTDAVLLKPLPYPDDQALVRMTERHNTRPQSGASMPAMADWAQFDEIGSLGAYEDAGGILRTGGDPARIEGQMVSPGFFPTMGVAPALGRTMGTADPMLDPDPKIVLSDRLWRERFGARPDVVGQLLQIDARTYTVIGVMPPAFVFPSTALFWSTLPTDMDVLLDARTLRFTDVIARMKPASEIASVESRLAAWAVHQRAAEPKAMSEWTPHVWSLRDELVGTVRKPLMVTMAGVGLLLLVACCNVASLLLAQGQMRQRSLAVRVAMGATRRRLLRQLMIEGALLAGAGTALALLFAISTQRAIIALSFEQIPRIDLMRVDVRVFAVVTLLGVMTTLLCALVPALVSARVDAGSLMGRSTRTSTGGRGRLLPALAAAEVALAIVLVAAAGLLINSYRQMKNVDLGFTPDHALSTRVTLPNGRPWNDIQVRRQAYDAVLANVRLSGDVSAAGLIAKLPLESVRAAVEVSAAGEPSIKLPAVIQETSEDYLAAAGMRLRHGRDFSATDRADQPTVAIINDVLAEHLFPGRSAIGQSVRFEFMRGPVQAQVVGVVHAVRYDGVAGQTKPEIYMTFRQHMAAPMSLVVRAAGEPMQVVPSIRAAMAAADPTGMLTIDGIATLDDRLGKQFVRPRFFLTLVGTFAVIGLLLASLGLYGMLSFWTVQHRREIGVRLALGATREQVSRLVIQRGLLVVTVGLTIGLGVTLATGRFMESLLFGVAATDPQTLLSAAAVLMAVAVLVCAVPGHHASRVDPIETLRAD